MGVGSKQMQSLTNTAEVYSSVSEHPADVPHVSRARRGQDFKDAGDHEGRIESRCGCPQLSTSIIAPRAKSARKIPPPILPPNHTDHHTDFTLNADPKYE